MSFALPRYQAKEHFVPDFSFDNHRIPTMWSIKQKMGQSVHRFYLVNNLRDNKKRQQNIKQINLQLNGPPFGFEHSLDSPKKEIWQTTLKFSTVFRCNA